jgi:hypothetical protein
MTDDARRILRGWLLLLALPFLFLWAALVWIPFLVLRKVVRWYRLPQHERDAINARSRRKLEADWEHVEQVIQDELRGHRLIDTPENRVRINSTMQKRRR